VNLPHLNISDPSFSTRSVEIKKARDHSFCATTPFGLAILRYKEVGQLLRDRRLRQGSYAWPEKNKLTGSFGDFWTRSVIGQEGDYHRKLRDILVPSLSQDFIFSLTPKFEAIANSLCRNLKKKKSCEFMNEFARPFAGQAMCILLGLNKNDWKMISKDASDLGLAMGVNCKLHENIFNNAYERLADLSHDLIKRVRVGNDKTSFVARLYFQMNKVGGLSDLELSDLIVISIFGGVDTTRSQLGLGIVTFIKHPGEWVKLINDKSLASKAFDELIRERPTTTWVTREANQDFEFSGVNIKKGTTLHLLVHSSSRDLMRQESPTFNISVKRKKHFGFGGGSHHCVGHFMAKSDSVIALLALSSFMRKIQYNGDAILLPDSGNTSPITLPIKYAVNY
jgi:cytochrome P450